MSAKKRITLILCLTLCLVVVVILNALNPTQSINAMTADNVSQISVELVPPNETILLQGEQVDTMLDLIHNLKPGHPTVRLGLNGQTVTITVWNSRGTQLTVMPAGSYVKINGIFYTTSYEECEALNNFANSLLEAS